MNWPFRIKTPEEILSKCKEMVKRHRRKFIQKNLRPCPMNCVLADIAPGREVIGCSGCGSKDPEKCFKDAVFKPLYSKNELVQQFSNQINNPQILLRDYRDLTVFFYCLGCFDMQKIDEHGVNKLIDEIPKP